MTKAKSPDEKALELLFNKYGFTNPEVIEKVRDILDAVEEDQESIKAQRFHTRTITKRDGSKRYSVEVFLGRDEMGKMIRVFVSADTPEEAHDKAYAVWNDQTNEKIKAQSKALTFGGFLTDWLKQNKLTAKSQNTHSHYQRKLKYVLEPTKGIPAIHEIKINDLNSSHFIAFYDALSNRQPKPLSGTTIRHIHTAMATALNSGVLNDKFKTSPMKGVKPPAMDTKEKTFLTLQETAKVLEAAKANDIGGFISLALNTGMRPEEIKALRWRDIDLVQGNISINRVYTYVAQIGNVLSTPKTKNSRRTIELDPASELMIMLRGFKQTHAERFEKMEKDYGVTAYIEDALVFSHDTTPTTPWSDTFLGRNLRSILKKTDLPKDKQITMYTFRHSHATLALANGEDINSVSKRLGHKNVQITYDTYIHFVPGSKRKAATEFSQMLQQEAEKAVVKNA